MRFLRRSLTGVFLLSLTAGLLVFAVVMSSMRSRQRAATLRRGAPGRERVFAVRIVTVEPQAIRPVLRTFGEIRSRRTLEVRAGTGGTVVELAPEVEEGGFVEKGQLIARIDPADAEAALDVARADLAEAESELRDAGRALELNREDLRRRNSGGAARQALERQKNVGARRRHGGR